MAVSAVEVKKLRDMTGAGMMDCKNALSETKGDIEKAIEYLRKKGIASAQKRSDKAANEGVIVSYIHPGDRLGVILEMNCETDFVAKTDEFKAAAKNIAMQIAASNPIAIQREHISQEVTKKEMEIFRSQAEKGDKPKAVVEKITQGKMEKYFQEVVLMEQSYVKEQSKTVKEYLMEVSGKLGEKMSIRRFVRYQLGEEL
jgi:elongation factor Ts